MSEQQEVTTPYQIGYNDYYVNKLTNPYEKYSRNYYMWEIGWWQAWKESNLHNVR